MIFSITMCSKTPIMILQEYTVKEGLPLPIYNEIENQGSPYSQCSVQMDGLNEIGTDRNKKKAKQNAAEKALKKLQIGGKYFPSLNANLNVSKHKIIISQITLFYFYFSIFFLEFMFNEPVTVTTV